MKPERIVKQLVDRFVKMACSTLRWEQVVVKALGVYLCLGC